MYTIYALDPTSRLERQQMFTNIIFSHNRGVAALRKT